MRHLYAKLGTHSRAEAVARARHLGLLAPPHTRARTRVRSEGQAGMVRVAGSRPHSERGGRRHLSAPASQRGHPVRRQSGP